MFKNSAAIHSGWVARDCASILITTAFSNGHKTAIKQPYIRDNGRDLRSQSRPNQVWTHDKIKEEAQRWSTRSEFLKNALRCYNAASAGSFRRTVYHINPITRGLEMAITKHICSHKRSGFYLRHTERVPKRPLRYTMRHTAIGGLKTSPNTWRWSGSGRKMRFMMLRVLIKPELSSNSGNSKAYQAARTRNILDDVCAHMTVVKQPTGHWTKEMILRHKAEKSYSDFLQKRVVHT